MIRGIQLTAYFASDDKYSTITVVDFINGQTNVQTARRPRKINFGFSWLFNYKETLERYNAQMNAHYRRLDEMLKGRVENRNGTYQKTAGIFLESTTFDSYRQEQVRQKSPMSVRRTDLTDSQRFIEAQDHDTFRIALYLAHANGCTDFKEVYDAKGRLIKVTGIPVNISKLDASGYAQHVVTLRTHN